MKIAMSIGCLMLAAIAGCAYAPDDDFGLGYPIWESPRYAIVPKARWTCLHYNIADVFGPESDIWIFLDRHRIRFTERSLGVERPIVVNDRIATADEWRWITGQLEKAGVMRWKKSYYRVKVAASPR